MSSSTDDLWAAFGRFLDKHADAGIETSGELVKAVIGLVGNMIQAVGVAAASVDPLQFAFIVGTALFVLNYLDQTEPYATILRISKLHGIIKYLHMPGTQSQDIVDFQNCVNDTIKMFTDAGVPVPAQLYQLKDSTNLLAIAVGFENLIPGFGVLDSTLTGIFNGAGLTTAGQLFKQACPAMKQWATNLINNFKGNKAPPTNTPSGAPNRVFRQEWTFLDLSGQVFGQGAVRKWYTSLSDAAPDPSVTTLFRGSWTDLNGRGLAGNLVRVDYYVTDSDRAYAVEKYAPFHSDVDNPANAFFNIPYHGPTYASLNPGGPPV